MTSKLGFVKLLRMLQPLLSVIQSLVLLTEIKTKTKIFSLQVLIQNVWKSKYKHISCLFFSINVKTTEPIDIKIILWDLAWPDPAGGLDLQE